MTGASWACTALLCWHLNFTGALPPEVPIDRARPYVTGQRQVRVLVSSGARSLSLRPDVPVAVEDQRTGARLATGSAGAGLSVVPAGDRVSVRGAGLSVTRPRLRVRPLKAGGVIISSRGGWGRRGRYSGVLDIARTPRGIRVVEHLDLEAYVAGVIAAEIPPAFPLEAMKAQAIAARTYALYHLGGHAADDADLCARVHCQAYHGMPPTDSTAAAAARQTAGQVLTWNDLLADALYHSACGGATAPAWEVRQGKLLPYLRGANDTPAGPGAPLPYCGQDHELKWTRRFSHRQAERLISSNIGRVLGNPGLTSGKLKSLRLVKADGRGRPRAGQRTGAPRRAAWLEVVTGDEAYRVRGDAIRWLFGTGYPDPTGLRSTAFDLTIESDSHGGPRSFTLRGVGHGHGIGLCQWGARARAAAGQSAEEILSAYYPGTAVTDLRQ